MFAVTQANGILSATHQYAPFGRFTQVDPVEGGVENNYVCPPDPVNKKDLDGKCLPACAVLALPFLYTALEALSETPTGSLSRGFKSPEGVEQLGRYTRITWTVNAKNVGAPARAVYIKYKNAAGKTVR